MAKYQALKRRLSKVIKEHEKNDFKIWIFASDEEHEAKKDQIKPYHKVIQIRPVTEADLCPSCKRVHSVCACNLN